MEEIHHSDRWSAAASRTAMCGSVSAFGDDLVSQSFIQALLTYGDHIQKTDIILSGMAHVAFSFSSQRNKGLFLWCFIFIGENVLSLANIVFKFRSSVNN